jgi:hypothetical protein
MAFICRSVESALAVDFRPCFKATRQEVIDEAFLHPQDDGGSHHRCRAWGRIPNLCSGLHDQLYVLDDRPARAAAGHDVWGNCYLPTQEEIIHKQPTKAAGAFQHQLTPKTARLQ